jgi:hypothetical protein
MTGRGRPRNTSPLIEVLNKAGFTNGPALLCSYFVVCIFRTYCMFLLCIRNFVRNRIYVLEVKVLELVVLASYLKFKDITFSIDVVYFRDNPALVLMIL